MTLTKHQILHLNAVILDCDEALADTPDMRRELAKNKDIAVGNEITYFNLVKSDANKILKNKKWPNLEEDWLIHDYLEKGRTDI